MDRLVLAAFLLYVALTGQPQQPALTGTCMLSLTHNQQRNIDALEVMLHRGDCSEGQRHCGNDNDSGIPWSRWTGITPASLQQEGAQLDAALAGDAGDLHCAGTVHDAVLAGRYTFTPSAAFVRRMESLGFSGITPEKQQSFLMLDITTTWAQQMKDAGVTGMTTDKLMSLKALRVDLEYIRALAADGYPELNANKLTEMRAVGVTPERIKEARELGFHPNENDLIQMCVFHIDRPFVERMRKHGLTDLTLHKLIQVKIFKLDEE